MGVVYSSATFMMRNALRVFGDWQVEGKECVPQGGRSLWCPTTRATWTLPC